MLVDAELDLAALDVGDSLGHVHRHGAGLRVRHEAAGAQDLTETTDLAHEVGRGDSRVEVGVAGGHLLDELVATDLVGTGRAGLLRLGGVGEHDDLGGLTRAVRQVDRATDHLVRLARVDAQAERDLDGRVVLDRGGLLGETDRVQGRVHRVGVDLLCGGEVRLAALCHVLLSLWS